MTGRCWCFQLCADSGMQCMLILAIFERSLYKYGEYLVREIIAESLLNVRLQSGANGGHVRFAASTTSNFWQPCNMIRRVPSVRQATVSFFLPSSFRQPHCVHSPGSPHPAHITSSQSSPSFSPSITPSTFHSRLKTHLFHKSFPP